VRNNMLTPRRQHRTFGPAVWIARGIGWTLLLVAILGAVETAFFPAKVGVGGFKLLPPIGLGLLAVVWIAGLEVFLHFFDRYLSGN
jgi:hypothetical protein